MRVRVIGAVTLAPAHDGGYELDPMPAIQGVGIESNGAVTIVAPPVRLTLSREQAKGLAATLSDVLEQ